MDELIITKEQLNFLNKEFGLTLDELNGLDDGGWEKVYNGCANIE